MPKVVKIAISVPEDEFNDMESFRKKEGISRSRFITETFKFWRDEKKRENLSRTYMEGYGRIPEKIIEEVEVWEKASLDAVSEGEW